ncbi:MULTISPECIES: 30S ribosome-binding factor RbfA [Leptospira]|uniref:Ribosome-binding factor A n=5 Tax=Leptospira santarosai TaxID=28183 RepID=A0AB73LKY6_9LEPT|nr:MULTISPECIES: 30S ribosome-binding factor RbfA [Leptospira]AIT10976.1 ribosome-binding factor A [Leptospira santarosai serovar Shermani str. LT 821]AVV51019.1 Ribosome-binding factor A [Leptospira santarosai]AVV78913.1 Ribosome-binding factor A [Leptospira santarosai]EKO34330.1 ribosome-binding factor A [Leptospira santarosai str. MOR084]EKO79803.1 ribosome-binding factor A [Leptospira sp. Fiocruz LV3954]
MNPIRRRKIEAEAVRTVAMMILSGKVKDPRVHMVSVHRAEISEDGKNMKVFVTAICTDKKKLKVLSGLNSAAGLFQTTLSGKLGLRITPRMQFLWDEEYIQSLDESLRLTRKPTSTD